VATVTVIGLLIGVIAGAVALWCRIRPPHRLPKSVVSAARWCATLVAAAGVFLVVDIAGRATTATSAAIAAGVIVVVVAAALRPDLTHPDTASTSGNSD
jgi:hypothetical protein